VCGTCADPASGPHEKTNSHVPPHPTVSERGHLHVVQTVQRKSTPSPALTAKFPFSLPWPHVSQNRVEMPMCWESIEPDLEAE
jgi:hypothetical protein